MVRLFGEQQRLDDYSCGHLVFVATGYMQMLEDVQQPRLYNDIVDYIDNAKGVNLRKSASRFRHHQQGKRQTGSGACTVCAAAIS